MKPKQQFYVFWKPKKQMLCLLFSFVNLHKLKNESDYISRLVKEPISIVMSAFPLEKMIYVPRTNQVQILNQEIIKHKMENNVRIIGFCYLKRKRDGYMIKFGKKYLSINYENFLTIADEEMNGTVFDIRKSNYGYKIKFSGMCLTNFSDKNCLMFKDCIPDGSENVSNQLFDFISLQKSNLRKILEMNDESTLDNCDLKTLKEEDTKLEKKFIDSIFKDDAFMRSMRYFYNYAVCIGKEKLNDKNDNMQN